MTPAITLERVGKRFESGLRALDDISLSIDGGQFVALLGPSGCGKTTLLRLVAGLDRASSGFVRASQAAPTLSYVFQDATLMPWASVRDNVALPLRIARRPRAEREQRVAPALAAVGLQRFADSFPAELSGGMRMRASIARALVTRPDVLLLDEPFAALDEITRQRLNADLLALWQAQRFTVLFVTHSVFEATFLAQRVIVLSTRPGRIVADIANDAPCPRDSEWRLAPAYQARCRAISAALETGYEHAEAVA